MRSEIIACAASSTSDSTTLSVNSRLDLPTASHSSFCAAMSGVIDSWPNFKASIKSASGISSAEPSNMTMFDSLPTYTRSRSLDSICSWVGLATNPPSMRPTRTAPIGPANGRSLIISAAEAPLIDRMSESFSPSALSSRVWTCTSLKYPLGNSGRIGRSVTRQVRISFSDGRPSRLKKPPGKRPAAAAFSR